MVEHYLQQPNTFVAAGVRDPAHQTAQALSQLQPAEGSKLAVLQLESKSDADHAAAVETLQRDHGIDRLDIVVSNAGICRLARLDEVELSELRDHVEVNAIAVVRLFQTTLPLLRKAARPRLLVMGSMAGSVGSMLTFPFPQGAYASSKAATNAIVRKIQMENDWLIALSIHPGWAQTDMGNDGARAVGMEKAAVPVEDSINGIISIVSGVLSSWPRRATC